MGFSHIREARASTQGRSAPLQEQLGMQQADVKTLALSSLSPRIIEGHDAQLLSIPEPADVQK